ncbi:hypothetical protein ALC56_09420 [Trachymyrmex septentrionalis]|uniref:Uncharacterized protein n=1 Tax=Trachymyrmex septentrionalis TaxID=34720 RepID=A0A195F8T5_9HYME|nr:hypothetical protein ALC56_09420 [Trachymyrmex septentrionalis]
MNCTRVTLGARPRTRKRSGAPAVLGKIREFPNCPPLRRIIYDSAGRVAKIPSVIRGKRVRSEKATILALLQFSRAVGNDDRHSFAEKETFASKNEFSREEQPARISTPSPSPPHPRPRVNLSRGINNPAGIVGIREPACSTRVMPKGREKEKATLSVCSMSHRQLSVSFDKLRALGRFGVGFHTAQRPNYP